MPSRLIGEKGGYASSGCVGVTSLADRSEGSQLRVEVREGFGRLHAVDQSEGFRWARPAQALSMKVRGSGRGVGLAQALSIKVKGFGVTGLGPAHPLWVDTTTRLLTCAIAQPITQLLMDN